MQKNKSEDVRTGEICRSNVQRASHAGFLKPFFIIFMSALSLAAAGFACGGGDDKASEPVAEDAGLIEDAGEENTCERTEPGDICCGTERCGVGHECGESGACEEIRPALLADVQGGVTEIHEDGSDSMTIHLSLSHNPRVGDVKVYWDISHSIWNEGDKVVCLSADGADGDAAANHGVILNAGNWQTGIDVTCRYDAEGTNAVLSPDSPIRLDFATQSDDNLAFNYLTASPGGLVLKDSDEAKVIVTLPEDLTTTEDGGSIQFRVRLASKPPSNADRLYLKITAANDDGTEAPYGLPDPEQLAFYHDYLCAEYDCWNKDQVVTVTGQDDRAFNIAAHTYTVTIGLRDEDAESCSTEEGKANPWCRLEPVVIHLLNADNESPNIVTDVTTFQVSESGTTARVGVKLSTQPIAPVTMTASIEPVTECALAGANGAASATATLNFPTDNTFDIYQYITVVGVDDSADDGNAACTLTLTAASDDSAHATGYNGKTLTLTGQNEDNDTAGILGMTPSRSIIAETFGNGTQTNGTMRLSLATEPQANVQVQMSSQNVNAADTTRHVSFSPFSLTFTPGNYSTPQTVTYTAIDDHKVNDTSSMQVMLLATPSSTDAKYNGDAAGATAQVTVKDTTYASLSVGSASTMRLSEATASSSPATIAVKLKSIPTAPVTFTVTSSDAARLKVGLSSSISAASGSVSRTIQPGSWSTELTVYAFAVDDNVKNAVNTAYLRFSWTSEDSNYNKGTTITTQDFTIVDNDTADFVVGTPSPATLYESSASSGASIKLSLTSKPTAQVNFTAASSDPERLKVSLTNSSSGASDSVKTGISPDSWQSGVTIYAFAVNDSIGNTNNTAKVTFTTTSRDSNFTGKSGETSNITIVDNDSIEQKTLTVSCGSVTAPCTPYGGSATGSCTVSLNSSNRPTNAQSVSVSCTSDAVWSSDTLGPKTLSSSNNWSTSITGLVSRCCGSVNGTANAGGTISCTATGTGFKATGSGTIYVRYDTPNDCTWIH